MIRIPRMAEDCQRRAAGMAAATRGRKTQFDGPTKASRKAEMRAQLEAGLEEWAEIKLRS